MSGTRPGHKVGPEGPCQYVTAAGRDPAPAGIEGDLVVWWLRKEVRRGRGVPMGYSCAW